MRVSILIKLPIRLILGMREKTFRVFKLMEQIKQAIKSIKSGRLVGMPTETVYGLAAPIDNQSLINRIFELKKRPFFDPLIVHVASVDQAKSLVKSWLPVCDDIVCRFWPGPVTLVLEKTDEVSDLITSGLQTVGIRIPRSKVARDFISQLGVPVAAPSANLFKKISPTCAKHVSDVFSSDDVFVLDDGPCEVGIESTIIKVSDHSLEVLRPGLISGSDFSDIAKTHNLAITYTKNTDIKAPGMLEEHYQPVKPLNVVCASTLDEAKIKLNDPSTYWFSLSDRPEIAARELYQKMREACENDFPTCSIWMEPSLFSDELWKGITDRLKKASSKFLQ